MANAWLLRPNPDGNKIKEFLNGEFIAIGWGDIGDVGSLSKDEIRENLAREYGRSEDEGQDEQADTKVAHWLSRSFSVVNMFVKSMNIGDLVLVPNGDDIHIGEIISDYFFEKDADATTFPHRRKVTWRKRVLRQNLTQELRASLRVLRTSACFTKYYDEIKSLAGEAETTKSHMIKTLMVSFPLRPDFIVNVEVPSDLNKDEATKLSGFFARTYFIE